MYIVFVVHITISFVIYLARRVEEEKKKKNFQWLWLRQSNYAQSDQHFPALERNHIGHKLEVDCDGVFMTWWLTVQNTDLHQKWLEDIVTRYVECLGREKWGGKSVIETIVLLRVEN